MKLLTALGVILDSLPQMLWWILGGTVLLIWGLAILVQLAQQGPGTKKMRKVELSHTGRLKEVQSVFDRTESGLYYQDETRGLLRSLTIGLIALRRDISDEAARQRLMRADRDDESSLIALLVEETDGRSERLEDGPSWNPPRRPIVLDDVETALGLLDTYNDFPRPDIQT